MTAPRHWFCNDCRLWMRDDSKRFDECDRAAHGLHVVGCGCQVCDPKPWWERFRRWVVG